MPIASLYDVERRSWWIDLQRHSKSRAPGFLLSPILDYLDRFVCLDFCEDEIWRKNQKLFSKTSAQTYR
jgi:hypothetical protein